MKLSVKNSQGKSAGELEVKFELVENGRGTQAVHDTVTGYRANQQGSVPAGIAAFRQLLETRLL